MFINNWKPVLAEADANVGGQTSPPPTGPQGSSQQGGADLASELARSREEVAALLRENKEYKAQRSNAKKQQADKAAIAAGETEKLIKERDEQLAEANARIEKMEKATVARLDSSIKKLPEAARKEIELIRDGLPTDKLEQLIGMKLDAAAPQTKEPEPGPEKKTKAPAPPAPSVSMRNQRQVKSHVHPETMQLFRRLSAPAEVVEMANNVFGRSLEQHMGPGDQPPQDFVGDHKFRLYAHVGEGTIEEVDEHDTATWIDSLRAISPPPRTQEMLSAMGRMRDAMAERN